MASMGMNICVYCGSRPGADARFSAAAHELGTIIGSRGDHLIYGGGRVGLMGVLADAVMSAGGRTTGVIPSALMAREAEHRGLNELIEVQTMHERKRVMAERADVFISMPGGLGTLEELFETWTWLQLGFHDKPIGLLNVAGYFDALLRFIGHSVDSGFVTQQQASALIIRSDPAALHATLAAMAPLATQRDDYRRI